MVHFLLLTNRWLCMQRETYDRRHDKVKRDVKAMVGKVKKPLEQLELMDVLQRLGIYYHLKVVIKRIGYRMDNQYNLDILFFFSFF